MDYLQYYTRKVIVEIDIDRVLNLIINGLPSILKSLNETKNIEGLEF